MFKHLTLKSIIALCTSAILTLSACDDGKSVGTSKANDPHSPAWYAANRTELATTIVQCIGDKPTLIPESKECKGAGIAINELGQMVALGYSLLSAAQTTIEQQAAEGVKENSPPPILNDPTKYPSLYIDNITGEVKVELIQIGKGIELYAVPMLDGQPITLGKTIAGKLTWVCYTNLPANEHILIPKNCRTTYASVDPVPRPPKADTSSTPSPVQ